MKCHSYCGFISIGFILQSHQLWITCSILKNRNHYLGLDSLKLYSMDTHTNPYMLHFFLMLCLWQMSSLLFKALSLSIMAFTVLWYSLGIYGLGLKFMRLHLNYMFSVSGCWHLRRWLFHLFSFLLALSHLMFWEGLGEKLKAQDSWPGMRVVERKRDVLCKWLD